MTEAAASDTETWLRWAAVRSFVPSFEDAALRPEVPDFPPSALSPELAALPKEQKLLLLGALWIQYNHVVVGVEGKLVLPSCAAAIEILGRRVNDEELLSVQQTETDELFHIIMSQRAMQVTRELRGLTGLRLPPDTSAERLSETTDVVGQLAIGYAIEATINFSLYILARDKTIQPANSAWVRAHWNDERVHSKVFRRITKAAFGLLSDADRTRFLATMDLTLMTVSAVRVENWEAILGHLDLPRTAVSPTLLFPADRLERARRDLRKSLATHTNDRSLM